jgi:hypothetical protein
LKGVAQVEIVLGALPPANLNVTENDVQAWPFLAEIFQLSQLRAKKAIPHECEFAHFLVKSWHRSPLIKIPCCHSQGCGIAAIHRYLPAKFGREVASIWQNFGTKWSLDGCQ